MVVPLRGVPHRIVHWSKVRGLTQATQDKDGAPMVSVYLNTVYFSMMH